MKDEKSPTNEKLYIVEKLLQKRIDDNQVTTFFIKINKNLNNLKKNQNWKFDSNSSNISSNGKTIQ